MPAAIESILICAPPSQPLPAVDAALAHCALAARRISDTDVISTRRADSDCGIAIVMLSAIPEQSSRALDAVRHLKHLGFAVFCCAPGAAAWPLGVHCRMLLAGAAHVLDTAASFHSDLVERITAHLESERAHRREAHHVIRQMRDLGLVGRGPGIMRVYRSILRVSPLSDLPVLISGETGTGKELVARSIHRLDPRRRNEPFIPVNCSAISAGLAESQLFGHRRGAFTGADQDRTGLIRAARGGVLFLDEIGDLEPALQGKLLRVLQEHRVLALGDDHEVPVHARVIAATNRSLEEMVRDQTFRSDLFHRLNVLSIRVPSLRERHEDVEALIRHFVALASPSPVTVTGEFIEALCNVDLPGNVRELENIVHRAMVTRINGEALGLGNLPAELLLQIAGVTSAALHADANGDRREPANGHSPQLVDVQSVLAAGRGTLSGALDLCEQEILAAALRMSRGNRSRAARMLGISARSIFNKMRKHRLSA
jgi:DNA-binding NtrC family response regulator